MTAAKREPVDERVLVLAPTGRDATLIREALVRAGIHSEQCSQMEELCRKCDEGAGALLIAEEALSPSVVARLSRTLEQQSPWSDIPLVLSTGRGETTEARVRTLASIGATGNVTILERPVRVITLIATVQAALRARRRQYWMRDLHAQIEHERAELELSRAEAVAARAAAEAANRAKDEFLAMLGHELRNPLAPILTALDLMRLRKGQPTDRERGIIERQARHMQTLVEDLLDISRITRGRIELEWQRVDIAELVAKALETAAPLLEQREHHLVTVVPERSLVVEGDSVRLVQVFANLITNAAKYTNPGGRIVVCGMRHADEVVLRVSDTGRGISPRMLPDIFDAFVQDRQRADRSEGGLGLGLTIVKSLVELHRGSVSAFSEGPGQGSAFTVRLPAAKQIALVGSTNVRQMFQEPLRQKRGRQASVLVVDDNIDAADTLAEALEESGYAVRVSYDPVGALKIADEITPDAAFVDIGLPVIDGYELVRRLRDRPAWRQVRLVALTGYGQESDRVRSREAGFDTHLVKPVDVEMLVRLLETLIDSDSVGRTTGERKLR